MYCFEGPCNTLENTDFAEYYYIRSKHNECISGCADMTFMHFEEFNTYICNMLSSCKGVYYEGDEEKMIEFKSGT